MPDSSEPRPRVAVVLAAGAGSRYDKVPKALLRVHGTCLIERAILALAATGVERFVVVTGAFADELSVVPRLPRLRGLRIELVPCPTWSEGNAHSLAEGAVHARAAFYLVMADHVFEPAIVEAVGRTFAGAPDHVHLATDADLDGVFDLADATKVRAEGDRVLALGKEIAGYDRADVGVFACPAWIADTAAAAIAAGARSVTEVMRETIREDRMRSVDVTGQVWQDVDTPAMRAEAQRRLLASARKPTDGPVSRWLNRPLSLATSRVLARFDVHPNSVTTFVFVLGLLAAALIVKATMPALIAAAIVTQLASIIDGCDGELARVNLRGSAFGAWYDTITDNIRYTLMVIASGVAVFRTTGSEAALIGAAGFSIAAAYLVVTMTQYLRRHGAKGTHLVIVARVEASQGASASPLARLLFRVRFLAKQDVLALIAAAALACGLPAVVLGGGVLAVVAMIFVVDRALAHDGEPSGGTRVLFGLAGGGLLAWMLVNTPLAELADAVAGMGPAVVLVVPIVLAWSLVNTLGLHRILGGRVGVGRLFVNRMVGDAYNAVVPAGGVGGEPVRIAMLRAHVPLTDAASGIVVDRLINFAASLLVSAAAFATAAWTLALPAGVGVALVAYAVVAGAAAAGLIAILVRGSIGTIATRIAKWLGGDAPPRRASPRAIAIALGFHVVGRALPALEVALYASLLGLAPSPMEIVFVTGVLHAVGAIGFMIPQGLGVAELGAVWAFRVLGHDPSLGLAFGLVRRARVLVFSATGVLLHLALGASAREAVSR